MEIILPHLEDYQKAVLTYHQKHPNRQTIVTISPRQVGKSTFIEVLLVYCSLKENGSKSIAISPIFSQSRKLYEEICTFAKPVIYRSNASSLEITFLNNSTIRFASAEQGDNLRGFTAKKSGIVVIDEAAFVKSDFFYNVVLPFTNVYGGNIFLFSTPKYKDGLLWELYCQGKDDSVENVYTFEWTNWDLSKYLTPDILELYSKQLPKLAFQCEYQAKFIDAQGTVFPDFKHCIGKYTLDSKKELYITIDWGTGSGKDDTSLCFGQIDDGKLKISHFDAFNDKSPTTTIDYIINIVKSKINDGFRDINITVEKNSIGEIYYSMLHEKIDDIETRWNDEHWREGELNISCGTAVTSNSSKKKSVEQLELLFERNLIVIPDDEKLKKQLSLFEAKIDKTTNTVYYAGANNSHDDCVMSLLFVVNKTFKDIV